MNREESRRRLSETNEKRYVYVLFALAAVMAVLRISFAHYVGNWFSISSYYDDEWYFSVSAVRSYYLDVLNLGNKMLIKEMIFAYFLCAAKILGVSYSTAVSLLWIFGATLAACLFYMLTRSKTGSFLTFCYFLWCPIAFEFHAGTRIYRQAIMAPMVLIAFCTAFIFLFMLIYYTRYRVRHICLTAVFLGAIVFLTAYIKEDGIWLLLCLSAATVLYVGVCVFYFHRDKKKCVSMVCISLVPLLLFGCLKTGYTLLNYKAFGIYATNNRTDSAIGEFVCQIYKIDSDERTECVWAPKDAIEKAFAVSPTLSEHPELLDEIVHTPWYSGDIEQNPIQGDFLCWVLRDALTACGLWTDYSEMEAFFSTVNAELDEAFESGELEKDEKFQLVSSTGGRSTEEILSLLPHLGDLYKNVMLCSDYKPGSVVMNQEKAKNFAYEQYATNTQFYFGDAYEKRASETVIANSIIRGIFKLYSIINCILAALCISGMAAFLIGAVRKKHRFFCSKCWYFACTVALLAISAVYGFAICWFCVFLDDLETANYWQIFYGTALVPMVYLSFLFGAALLLCTIKSKRQEKTLPSCYNSAPPTSVL